MRKPNFFHPTVDPITLPEETKIIKDPLTEEELEIGLRALDTPRRHMSVDLANELQYIYMGDPESGLAPQKRLPMILTKDKRKIKVEISRNLCFAVARIVTQQTGTTVDDRVTPEQLFVSTITQRGLWTLLDAWSIKLQADYDKSSLGKNEGNDSGEGEGD